MDDIHDLRAGRHMARQGVKEITMKSADQNLLHAPVV